MTESAPFSHLDQIEQMYSDDARVSQVIPRDNEPGEKNISRSRLLRVGCGLHHILTETIPQIEDVATRNEVYLWVSRCYNITQFEQLDQEKGR